jgi:hypothetical protein
MNTASAILLSLALLPICLGAMPMCMKLSAAQSKEDKRESEDATLRKKFDAEIRKKLSNGSFDAGGLIPYQTQNNEATNPTSSPQVERTTWRETTYHAFTLYFAPSRELRWEEYLGSWKQVGDTIEIGCDKGRCVGLGVIKGNVMIVKVKQRSNSPNPGNYEWILRQELGAPKQVEVSVEPTATPTPGASSTIEISSEPAGAEIYVDGVFAGSTPSKLSLRAGEHVIKVMRLGFKEWERKVIVDAHSAKTVNAILEKKI